MPVSYIIGDRNYKSGFWFNPRLEPCYCPAFGLISALFSPVVLLNSAVFVSIFFTAEWSSGMIPALGFRLTSFLSCRRPRV